MSTAGRHYVEIAEVNSIPVITITVPQIRQADHAYQLRDEVLDFLKSSPVTNLVFDLRNVTFIGSIGFMAFLGVRRALPEGRVILCEMSSSVRDLFAICHLVSSDPAKRAPFEAAETRDAAIAMLAG